MGRSPVFETSILLVSRPTLAVRRVSSLAGKISPGIMRKMKSDE
jgi:hypothetical protein